MKKIVSNLSKLFLKEMQETSKDEVLDSLIEVLESEHDPDPSELYLLESLYQLKEKIKIVESKLTQYVIRENRSSLGNKLDDLYNSRANGTSKLFND